MKKDPHCYWCGTEVIYYPLHGGSQPDNFATLDHLNSRNQFEKRPQQPFSRVLSCYKCNWERGKAEEENQPKEELWKRSGRPPLELR